MSTTRTRPWLAAGAARQGWAPSPHEWPGELADEYYRGDAKITVHYTRGGTVHWATVRNSAGDLVATIYRGGNRAERVLAAFARTDLGPVPALTALEAAAYAFGWVPLTRASSVVSLWRRGEEHVTVYYSGHGVEVHEATRHAEEELVGHVDQDYLDGTRLDKVLGWLAAGRWNDAGYLEHEAAVAQ